MIARLAQAPPSKMRQVPPPINEGQEQRVKWGVHLADLQRVLVGKAYI